ncbi:gp650 [Bacillus phage G]|uniref:Gp650 n=1 Tax=Bacillus phage G TaxID=2884420 RepID=G3MB30_9CAUD|nr:gp650 [Bacillus phage G]AEO93893.1 gp650 [Bacillus phage G]
MKAKEKALKYLSGYPERYPEGYTKIDSLIEPLCKLLTEKGYVTLHSCSSHVRIRSYKKSMFTKVEEDERFFSPFLGWYVSFVVTHSIKDIQKAVKIINKKYGYGIRVYKRPAFQGVTRRWMLEKFIDTSWNDDKIYELNKNVYLEFKKFFEELN